MLCWLRVSSPLSEVWSLLSGYLISSCCFFFAHDYLANHNQQQPIHLLGPIDVPSEKSPEFQTSHNPRNYLQLAKPHPTQSKRQIIVGIVLMLRSCSPTGSWSVSKEAMGQLLGRRNRRNFWVLGGEGEMQREERQSSPGFREKKAKQLCEILGGVESCGRSYKAEGWKCLAGTGCNWATKRLGKWRGTDTHFW